VIVVFPREPVARIDRFQEIDRRDAVFLLQLSCDVLGPGELGRVQVDEDVRLRDVQHEVARGVPPVAGLADGEDVLDVHAVTGDCFRPVVEHEERSVARG
jgi:hypothetical protein